MANWLNEKLAKSAKQLLDANRLDNSKQLKSLEGVNKSKTPTSSWMPMVVDTTVSNPIIKTLTKTIVKPIKKAVEITKVNKPKPREPKVLFSIGAPRTQEQIRQQDIETEQRAEQLDATLKQAIPAIKTGWNVAEPLIAPAIPGYKEAKDLMSLGQTLQLPQTPKTKTPDMVEMGREIATSPISSPASPKMVLTADDGIEKFLNSASALMGKIVDKTLPQNPIFDAAEKIDANLKAAKVYEQIDFQKYPELETLAKEGVKGGLLGMAYYVDFVERPLRKTIFPQLFSNLSLLSKLARYGQVTDDDVTESRLFGEYRAGGSIDGASQGARLLADQFIQLVQPSLGAALPKGDVASYIDYVLETELSYRAKKEVEITDYYNKKFGVQLTPEEFRAEDRKTTIFGMPAVDVLDTFISYGSSLLEGGIVKDLAGANMGKLANLGAKFLHGLSRAVYPTAVATALADTSMKMGLLGEENKKGLANWIAENNLDIEQAVNIMVGISVLGTGGKILGKVYNGAKYISLDDSAKAFAELEQKYNTDPTVVKQAIENFKSVYVKTVEDFTRGKSTVKDWNILKDKFSQLPPSIQKLSNDLTLRVFQKNLFDGAIAGYAQPSINTLSVDLDAIARPRGQAETRVLEHEMAHMFEKSITNDPKLGAEWTKLIEGKTWKGQGGIGKGFTPDYKNTTPAEYFAEGVSQFIKTPEVLKIEDPELYNFMAKAVPEFDKLLSPNVEGFMPRTDIVYDAKLGHLKTAHDVPMNLVEFAKPIKNYKTASEFIAGLRKGDSEGVNALMKMYDVQTPEMLFNIIEGEVGSKFGDLEGFFKHVKLAPSGVKIGADVEIPEGYKPLMGVGLRYDTFENFKKAIEAEVPKLKDLPDDVPGTRIQEAIRTALKSGEGLDEASLEKLFNAEKGFMPREQEDLVDRIIKYDKFNLSQKQAAEVERIVSDLGMDTRTVKSFEQMKEGAKQLLANPDELLRADYKRLTDDQVVALKQMVNTDMRFMVDAEGVLAKNQSTDPALLRAKINVAEDRVIRAIQILAPGMTEQGRALVANKIIADRTLDFSFWSARAQKELGENVSDQKLKDTLGLIRELITHKDQLGLASLMASLKESTFTDKLVTLWKAGLLTSPMTHIRNIGSNTVFGVLEAIKDIPAVVIDKAAAAFTGKRTLSLVGLADQVAGLPKGFGMAQEYLKYGSSLDNYGKAELIRQTNFSDSPLGKFADKYSKTVFRILGAEDAVFKGRIEAVSLKSQAKTVAINEGLKGKAADARINELMANPTKEMTAIAKEDAALGTFNNENVLSVIINRARNAARSNPAAQIIMESAMPFVRTPTNVALRTLDYSPVGVIKGLYELAIGKQRAGAMDLGRGITGSMIMGLGAILAQKGMLTGTYPTGGEQKKEFKAKALRGGDLVINGHAVNLMGFSPLGNLLQTGAAFYENIKEDGISEGIGASIGEYAKGLTEMTFLAGLSNVLSAVTEPQRGFKQYVASAISGMVPTVIAQLVEVGDAYQRTTEGYTGRLQSRLPGMRQTLDPRFDMFGQPLKTSQETLAEGNQFKIIHKAFLRMLDPVQTRKLPTNDLLTEYDRLVAEGFEAYPSTPSENAQTTITFEDGSKKKIEWKYDDESYNVFQEITGRLMADGQRELMGSDYYRALDDKDKAKKLKDVYDAARDTAKMLVLPLVFENNPKLYQDLEKELGSGKVEEVKLVVKDAPWPSEIMLNKSESVGVGVEKDSLWPRNERVQNLIYSK